MALNNKKDGYAREVVNKAIHNLKLDAGQELLEKYYLAGGFQAVDDDELFCGAFERLARKNHSKLSEEILRIVRSDYDALYS